MTGLVLYHSILCSKRTHCSISRALSDQELTAHAHIFAVHIFFVVTRESSSRF